jgi:hypothetical protein
MRLYYMTSLETAINYILPEQRMRLARLDKLNDPFELLSAQVQEKPDRLVFKTLRNHWINTMGVMCMGLNWKSPLLWAHYAKNHTGICLGFDVDDGLACQMSYEPERLKVMLDSKKPYLGLDEEFLLKVMTTKYSEWSYEKEWRLFGG